MSRDIFRHKSEEEKSGLFHHLKVLPSHSGACEDHIVVGSCVGKSSGNLQLALMKYYIPARKNMNGENAHCGQGRVRQHELKSKGAATAKDGGQPAR